MELKPVFSAEAIQRRVREMAAEIDALYGEEPLVVICVFSRFSLSSLQALQTPFSINSPQYLQYIIISSVNNR